MTETLTRDPHGVLVEPATLKIERLLPGPVERVWSYLTDGELRRRWLAAGAMDLRVGAGFDLVWRNDGLSDAGDARPESFSEEERMTSRITEVDPPRRLSFTWMDDGEVTFELTPQGREVLLTVIHRRLPDRAMSLCVAAGWHTHLDILVARLTDTAAPSFWRTWTRLQAEYDSRLPT